MCFVYINCKTLREGAFALSLHTVWNGIPSWLKAVDPITILMVVFETFSSYFKKIQLTVKSFIPIPYKCNLFKNKILLWWVLWILYICSLNFQSYSIFELYFGNHLWK